MKQICDLQSARSAGRARHLFIGTHGRAVHSAVRAAVERRGFEVEFSFQSCSARGVQREGSALGLAIDALTFRSVGTRWDTQRRLGVHLWTLKRAILHT